MQLLLLLSVFCFSQARSQPFSREDSLKMSLASGSGNKAGSLNMQTGDSLFDFSIDLAEQLLPIDTVLQIAVQNSASVRMTEYEMLKFKHNQNYTRYLILNSLQVFYNYTYGNQFTNLVQSNVATDVQSANLGVGYRVGVNLSIPFGEFLGRSSRLRSQYYETELVRQKMEDVSRIVKKQVVDDYFNLIQAQKTLLVKSQDMETSRVTAEIALIDFKRGKIPPSELSRYRNILAIAETNFELAKRDFMVAYYKLEITIGIPLYKIKKKGGKS